MSPGEGRDDTFGFQAQSKNKRYQRSYHRHRIAGVCHRVGLLSGTQLYKRTADPTKPNDVAAVAADDYRLADPAVFGSAYSSACIVEQRAEEDERAIEKGSTRRFVLMVLSLVIYVALFEVIGAVFCGILATLVLFVAHPVRTWWVYSLAFLFPIIVTLLFVEVMNVPLPIMPLGF